MKWRKTVTLAFLILIGGNVFGQQRSPIDLILVLDTSSGMSRYYSQVNHYLTGSFLQDNLRLGDTFHLIAFSNEPRVEITRRVEGRGDLETIIGRMLLMYPLEPQADIPAALSFLKTYTENLSPSRPRKIIILSLGEGTAVTAESFPRLLEESRRQLGGDLEHINPAGLPLPSARPAVPEPPRPAVPAVTPAPVPRPEVPAAAPAPIPRPEAPAAVPAPQAGAPSIPIPEQPPVPRVESRPSAPEPLPPVPRSDPNSSPRPAVPAVTPAPVPQAGAPSIPIPEQPPVPIAESRPPAPEPLPPVPIPESEALVPPPVPDPEPLPIPELEVPPVLEPLSEIEPLEPSEESATVPAPVSPVSPQNTPRRTERPVREGSGRVVIFILLGLLGLVLLGLAAFFLIRRLHESPNRAVARAAGGRDSRRSRTTGSGSRGKEPQKNPQIRTQSPPRNISGAAEPPVPRAAEPYRPPRRESPYTDTYKPAKRLEYGSPFMLKLFVADQNTLIGKRNTHRVKPGFTYTVGGGKSDFLIFLVPFPPRLGELKYESSGCTFYPRKAAYFPDIGNNPVHDCIGKTIRVISDRGYEIFMRLEQHEDPLLELNRLMLSINVPNPTGMQPPG
ncbi:MAG: VWA domain-containing protein [Treponema sp.]|nr:VWA domain-containing protein [Treponema sp.]